MKKSLFVILLLVLLCVSFLPAQSSDYPALRSIINHFAARNYSTGSVTRAELDLILQAGINAPSASNRQPWHFTVVQDYSLARQILSQTTEGNILIVVSAVGSNNTSGAVILDCGLAVQSIYLAAQAIGLGSRIYTNPINTINSRYKAELGLTNNHNVVAVIRIGRLPAGVDAVSSASSRNNADRMVTYK